MSNQNELFKKLISHCKEYGFIFQSSEIYDSLAATYDYGPFGVSVIDSEGDLTTTLVNNKQCAFVYSEKGINKCSIEKAYKNGDIDFNKPISCHLFPVRITNYESFDALNIEKLKICSSGFTCGKSQKIPLYKFLKNALIRKYGKDWYEKLDEIAKII